jgi:uncharacterized protein YceK
LPTYTYARVYTPGAILSRHTDRDACEISITLNLNQDTKWPIWIKKPIKFYRAGDIIKDGDNAKSIGTLKMGYSFVFDSVLMPTETFTNYGFVTAKRSDAYWTFYGNDKKYYAVKYADDNRFDLRRIIAQGAQSVTQQQATTAAILAPTGNPVTDFLTGLTSTAKTVLYIGVAVLAVGYLLPKIIKK